MWRCNECGGRVVEVAFHADGRDAEPIACRDEACVNSFRPEGDWASWVPALDQKPIRYRPRNGND
jgi:hypothetical protein